MNFNGCEGGNLTGSLSCDLGTGAPLCSSCSEGYFRERDSCSKCRQAEGAVSVVVLLILLCVVVVYACFHIHQRYILLPYLRDKYAKRKEGGGRSRGTVNSMWTRMFEGKNSWSTKIKVGAGAG